MIDADAATKDIDSFQGAFAMYTDNMGKYNIVCTAPTVIKADRDCEHCSRTYGTLGCCSTVSNKWIYSCEEGHREYEETHKHMTIPEAIEVLAQDLPCETDEDLCEAMTMAIDSLKAWSNLKSEILAIGNWRNENEISDNGVKDCLAIIDRHIAEIRGD